MQRTWKNQQNGSKETTTVAWISQDLFLAFNKVMAGNLSAKPQNSILNNTIFEALSSLLQQRQIIQQD